MAGARWLTQRYGDVDLTIGAASFAQPNPQAAGLLYRELVDWAGQGQQAFELFAGGGGIAMHLAPSFAEVTALEVDRSSVERGRRDAERLGLTNITFTRADAREVRVPTGVDLIVVDPPRAGLAAELRDTLATALSGQAAGGSGVATARGQGGGAAGAAGGHTQARLLYVSCDVATWARDVADLEARGLELLRFEPFDFYPHTHHIEILSLLAPRAR
jgi:tRNA/tmRNA/rRNA uracil-C5-methylase (TrmA/RlmC/RlmD family)